MINDSGAKKNLRPPSVAQRMRAAAILRGLTADEIARRSSLTPAQIHERWAGRVEPSRDELESYALALAVSPRWLVHGTGEPIPGSAPSRTPDTGG